MGWSHGWLQAHTMDVRMLRMGSARRRDSQTARIKASHELQGDGEKPMADVIAGLTSLLDSFPPSPEVLVSPCVLG